MTDLETYLEIQGNVVKNILKQVRKFKSDNKLPLNAEIAEVLYSCEFELDESALSDLKNACNAKVIRRIEDELAS